MEPLTILHGVSEGSVLSLHLFNLYIYSLFESLSLDSVIAYADNITLVAHGVSAAKATKSMQELLQIIDNWVANNLMAVNVSKRFHMLVSPYISNQAGFNECCPSMSIGNKPLSNVTSLGILGVVFCNNLSWMAHSDSVR